EHRDVRRRVHQQVREDDALRLEAGGDARRLRVRERLVDDRHDSSSSSASRSAALIGALTIFTECTSGLVIMPAPAVKCVAGSMMMKLPVARFSVYGSNTSGRAVDTFTVPI